MHLMWWTISQQENWVIKMIFIEAGHKKKKKNFLKQNND